MNLKCVAPSITLLALVLPGFHLSAQPAGTDDEPPGELAYSPSPPGPPSTVDQTALTARVEVAATTTDVVTRQAAPPVTAMRRLRFATRFPSGGGGGPPRFGGKRAAGDWLTDIQLSTDFSYAFFDDGNVGGSGHDRENSVFVTGSVGDNLQLGLSYSNAEYEIGRGAFSFERQTDAIDFFSTYFLNDNLAAGMFAIFAHLDEDTDATTNLDTNRDVWGAGLLVSGYTNIKEFDVGLTTTLSTASNRSVGDFFNNKGASWATMVDVQKSWTDSFTTGVYGTFFTLIDNESMTDGTFWFVGGDVSYAPTDWVVASVGYEKTIDFAHFQDHRLNAHVAFAW